MKKSFLTLCCSLFLMSSHAEESLCGYKDYFHLANDTHPRLNVVSGYTDGDVLFNALGPQSFVIRDTWQCRSGFAHVKVADDSMNGCLLEIKDGPYMSHPLISAACYGNMNYGGIRYDGTNAYAYTLKFN